jgi:hypothetical protein
VLLGEVKTCNFSDTSTTLRVPDDALDGDDNGDEGVDYKPSAIYRGFNT